MRIDIACTFAIVLIAIVIFYFSPLELTIEEEQD